jgi:hypothetical protein
MAEGRLRVNGQIIQALRCRLQGASGEFDILMVDPQFGAFPLSSSCLIEFQDLKVPKEMRDRTPSKGWVRLTYSEMKTLVRSMAHGLAQG